MLAKVGVLDTGAPGESEIRSSAMKNRKPVAATLAACLIAAGATAGIAQSATAKHATKKTTESGSPPAGGPMRGPGGAGGFGGPGGPGGFGSVHSVDVVLNKARTAYISETTDSGTVKSVDPSAGTITIVEGTGSVTYATPTITIPSEATVTLDGKTSSLSSLVEGDHVTISSSSEGTTVFAADSSFQPKAGAGPHSGPPPGSSAPSSGSSSSGSSSGSE
jgi:hypothetical protein